MKYYLTFLAVFLLCGNMVFAGSKKDVKTPPKTEQQMVDTLLYCMHYTDTVTYQALFPTFDTLWKMILEDTNPANATALGNIRAHPEKVQQFDPSYNRLIIQNFSNTLAKGKDSNVHWNNIALRGYKLQKISLTRDMIGYEKIAPLRFQGYIFIRDMLTRRNYVVSVNELQCIRGYWYGGQVINIFPGTTIDDYEKALAAEIRKMKRRLAGIPDDTVQNDTPAVTDDGAQMNEDEGRNTPKEITDRKYYVGKFDNEIPVKLYVRYLKGSTKKKDAWEAIYKVGDQKKFVKLDVTKDEEGTWSFVEDPPIGYMDLTLKNKVYFGGWSTTDEKRTGYDVRLTETEVTNQQLHQLDDVFEKKSWARPDDNDNGDDEDAPKKRRRHKKEEDDDDSDTIY